MPNGKYLAVALDRSEDTLVVVSGIGTAKPRVMGKLVSPALGNETVEEGTGAFAFLPSSPDRGVIATRTGIAVLNVHKPGHPRLKVKTDVGNGSTGPSSVTVSPDSDHVAVAVGGKIFGFRNVHAAAMKGKHFKKQTSFRLASAPDVVLDLAYTGNDTLAALHGDPASDTGWLFTLIKKVPKGHHAVRGSLATTQPGEAGSLSVWPAP
jgi:hypothetical protein